MLRKLLTVLLLPCLAVIICGCLCGGLVLLAGGEILGSAREFLTAPFRWLQRGQTSPDLYLVLDEGREGTFRISQPCEFQSTEGNIIQSNIDPGEQFARSLTRHEAIDLALASLQQDLYQTADRNITLNGRDPVRYQLLPGDEVSLSFEELAHDDISVTARSLNGVVRGNRMDGSLHLSEDRSFVTDGQGIEFSTAIDVSFSCPLLWENID